MNIKQTKRPEFKYFFDSLEINKMILPEDRNVIQEKIFNKKDNEGIDSYLRKVLLENLEGNAAIRGGSKPELV